MNFFFFLIRWNWISPLSIFFCYKFTSSTFIAFKSKCKTLKTKCTLKTLKKCDLAPFSFDIFLFHFDWKPQKRLKYIHVTSFSFFVICLVFRPKKKIGHTYESLAFILKQLRNSSFQFHWILPANSNKMKCCKRKEHVLSVNDVNIFESNFISFFFHLADQNYRYSIVECTNNPLYIPKMYEYRNKMCNFCSSPQRRGNVNFLLIFDVFVSKRNLIKTWYYLWNVS